MIITRLIQRISLKNDLIFIFSILLVIISSFSCGSATKKPQEPGSDSLSQAKEIVCFVYHRFGDNRYPSTNISLQNFEAHLSYLQKNNFQVLTFSEAHRYLQSEDPVQKTAVITVDDGYQSFYENGVPLLEKFGYPATLFINTETVGGNDYMDWELLQKSQERGVEIGNHTHSHAYILNLPVAERYDVFREELTKSQQMIKGHLGVLPETFAYPYGELDDAMKQIVKESGFKSAAAQNSGVIYTGTDPYKCPRFPMSEAYAAPEKFASKAAMKALQVIREIPSSFIVTDTGTPKLKLQFEKKNLLLEQLQCFIQGSTCEQSLELLANDQVILIVAANNSIRNRRRTLYTITVPDSEGNWHWFSHLWINPEIR